MKISLAFMEMLNQGLDLPKDPEAIIDRIGSQLGEVENVRYLKPFYQDALIVKVVSTKKLEGSDHLSVCLIDDKHERNDVDRQQDGLIKVVCGAANVQEGQVAVWLPPGSIVPSSAGETPLRLDSRKIMGVISNGMLASAKELALSNDHEGIVVLPEGSDFGNSLVEYLHLDDWVIDIENKMFTHRPDLFGQIGVAREIAAIFKRPFKSPDWYSLDNNLTSNASGNLSVENRLKNSSCPRFMSVSIGNIKVKPSPLWMQSYLSRCGIRPINNIVDVTNFVMIATGQPLHAYDLDKVSGNDKVELIVRNAEDNEKLVTIDGSEINLTSEDIVIANSDKVLALGGVMGGRDSEVSHNTTSIVLECANFDMYKVRKTSMSHGIFSEAVTRFNKGQSPWQCAPILAYATSLINELCPDADIISEVVDSMADDLKLPEEVSLDIKKLDSYLGIKTNPNELLELLGNAELACRIDSDKLYVKPPFWRTDLDDSVDLVEEVARLTGFDKIPMSLPSRLASPPFKPNLVNTKLKVRESLAAAGANELLTYSFVDGKLLEAVGQETNLAFKLSNALSPDLEYYRISMIPSLMSKVHPNHKAGFEKFVLFEIGKVHIVGEMDSNGLPLEKDRLSLIVSATEKITKANIKGPAFYQLRAYLDYLLGTLGIDCSELRFVAKKQYDDVWIKESMKPFQKGRSSLVLIGDEILGYIGEFHQKSKHSLKLPDFCAGLELDLEQLEKLTKEQPREYRPLSRFPKVYQDVTISDAAKGYQDLLRRIEKRIESLSIPDIHLGIKPIDAYQAAGDEDVKWTFRITAESNERTLTDREIGNIIDKIKQD